MRPADEGMTWSREDSADLYGISNWSNDYFAIGDKGEVVVRLPDGGEVRDVSLVDVVSGMRERGMQLPVLLRFSDLLDARISALNETFQRVIEDEGYKGRYRGVYPIKVNQQRAGHRGDHRVRQALPLRPGGREQGRS